MVPFFTNSQSFLKFAGAAQSLGAGALLVNPWNITEVAKSIDRALNMDAEEREKRHRHNFLHVTTHTAQEWAETFVRYPFKLLCIRSLLSRYLLKLWVIL